MSKKKLIIGGIVVVILLIVLGASIFGGGGSETAAPETGVRRKVYVSAEDASKRDQLLAILKNLQNIKLDGQIFDRSAFKSLLDFSVPLLPQPTGRRNPFAPINPFEFSDNSQPPASPAASSTPPKIKTR